MWIKILLLINTFQYCAVQTFCPNYLVCESSRTPKLCLEGTYYKEKVRVNGCCPGCVILNAEGEKCNASTECAPGLTCNDNKICEKDPKACEQYKLNDKIWKKFKYWKPKCEADGTFAPKQCKGEKITGKCFCTDRDGKRIFGEESWINAESMTCACSRLMDEMRRSDKEVTFHCDHLGNFEVLQCDKKVCWCASPQTGIPYTIMVPTEMMEALPCYNKNQVGVQYYKKCDSELHMQEVAKSLLKNHGTYEIAFGTLNCNFDGSYARVQRFKEKTKCVYLDNSYLTEAVAMGEANCNCAYDRHVHQLNQMLFVYDCLPNGDYAPRQTWNGKTYCVDADGFTYSNNTEDCFPDNTKDSLPL